MADNLKDKEQDMRLDTMEKDLYEIKGVTHGSDVHNWDGIVSEHNKMMAKISTSFIAIITTLLTVAGGIVIAVLKLM